VRRYHKGKAPLGYPDWPYTKNLPSHAKIIKSTQSQMRGQGPTFCMLAQDPSESEGEDSINGDGLSDVSLHGNTKSGSSCSD